MSRRVLVAVVPILALGALLALGACASFGADTPERADAEAGPSASDGAPDGDEAVPDGAAPGDAGACPHLRCLTFEDGLTGFDQKMGAPILVMGGAAKGTAALGVSGTGTYIVLDIAERSELWLSFYVKLGAVSGADAVPFEILSTTSAPLATAVMSGRSLLVRIAQTENALGMVDMGSVYRVGLHIKQNGGGEGLSVEGSFASNDEPFGGFKFAVGANTVKEAPRFIRLGSVGTTSLTGAFDDVFVSLVAMPPPSP